MTKYLFFSEHMVIIISLMAHTVIMCCKFNFLWVNVRMLLLLCLSYLDHNWCIPWTKFIRTWFYDANLSNNSLMVWKHLLDVIRKGTRRMIFDGCWVLPPTQNLCLSHLVVVMHWLAEFQRETSCNWLIWHYPTYQSTLTD